MTNEITSPVTVVRQSITAPITISTQQIIAPVSVGQRGPQGEPGEPGTSADSGFFHAQASPLAVWEITHNLQRYPSVVVIDSAGSAMEGEIIYLDPDTIKLIFAAPFAGAAQLN